MKQVTRVEILLQQGGDQLDRGRHQVALEIFEQAARLEPQNPYVLYELGLTCYRLGQYQKSVEYLNQALQLNPKYPLALARRGLTCQQLGLNDQANADFEQATQIQPRSHEDYFGRGMALDELQRYEEAVVSFDKAIEIKPGHSQTWYSRGIVLYYLGRYEEALASYDRALEIKPDYSHACYIRGIVLSELGRYEEALASYDQALNLEPDFPEAWTNRGKVLNDLQRHEEAISSYDRALKSKSDFPEAWIAWRNQGNALCDLQRYEESLASYSQALEIKSDYHEAWYEQGLALSKVGRREEAITSWDKALLIKPEDEQAWYYRGLSLYLLKRYEEALTSYSRSLQLQQDDPETWFAKGLVLSDLQRYEEALASYDRSLQFQQDNPRTWCKRGLALSELQQHEAAIASYERALKIQPDYHEAWFQRGVELSSLEQYEKALASYDRALKIQPDFLEVCYNRGAVLKKLDRYQEAIASYDRSLKIKPNFPEAWTNRGIALANLQRYEEAIASYDRALKITIDFQEAWIAWHNRGDALADLRRYEEAINSYDQALKIGSDCPEAWIAWHNRGRAAGQSDRCEILFVALNPLATKNSALNQRGYEGALVTYKEGLKSIHQHTHPEGWGQLHLAIGNTHYLRGRLDCRPDLYWYKAIDSYNEALKSITEVAFPETYLEILQDLIQVYVRLGQKAKAEELQRRGSDLIRRLLNDSHRSDWCKKQIALKFVGFNQLTVDSAAQSGQVVKALEVAEAGKNSCLTWLLDAWNDEIFSANWEDIKQLVNPKTALVYWHLSPIALTTFIIRHDVPEPIVLEREKPPLQENELLNRLLAFETWVKDWNQQYQEYRNPKQGKGQARGSWRDQLPEMLKQLANILDIPTILQKILKVGETGVSFVTQLILIPHRDLHRFPLHALFPTDLTIAYLPSAQTGVALQKLRHAPVGATTEGNAKSLHKLPLLSVEHSESEDLPSLEFAQFESEVVCYLFSSSSPKRIGSLAATKNAVLTALPSGYSTFHFAGHSTYNFHNPARSHLALTGSDQLTLADICQYDLSSYRLVSLSACETALTGNQAITTEYVGLVSGFMRCGVNYVVSTLWTVESAASALVMIQFYQLLKQGKSEPVALTAATYWLRHLTVQQLQEWYESLLTQLSPDEERISAFLETELYRISRMEPDEKLYSHPYYWAAFIITGIR